MGAARRGRALSLLCLTAVVAALVSIASPARAAGELTVVANSNPTTIMASGAPGTNVTFEVDVTNNTEGPVTITTITDSVYGNLAAQGTCNTAVGSIIAADATYSCSYVAAISGVAGASQVNTVTVSAKDSDDVVFSASDVAVVVITPRLGVGNNASPASLVAPGGTVTFSVSAVNLGSIPLTISAITDSVYGNLATQGTCVTAVGTVLASQGANYACSYTATVTGTAGQSFNNTATITATGTGGPFSGSDLATVAITSVAANAATTTSTSTSTSVPVGATTSSTTPSSTAGLVVNLGQASGVPGERFVITGEGWTRNEILTITLNSTPKVLTTTVVDNAGRFNVTVKVPDDATTGAHTIVVTGQANRSVSKAFTVNAGGTATTTTIRTGTLARTGPDDGGLTPLAVLALMLGGAAVAGTTRGRRAWAARSRTR